MLESLELTFDQQAEIKAYCEKIGIEFLSTPYDTKNAAFLSEILKVDLFKTASADIVDYELHTYISKTKKPVIISTGMASLADIEFALSFYDEPYYKYIYLLQCTSNYPSSDESLNLNTIPMLRTAFNTHVGFSDHSFDAVSAIAAIACGARLIERHFTLDKDMHGPDHSASLDPNEFKNMQRI